MQTVNENQTISISLSDLSEAARRAHNWLSFDPEKRGNNMIKEYESLLSSDLAKITGASSEEKARYIAGFRKHLSHYISSLGNTASAAIAGPSKFNFERNRKRQGWANSALEALNNYREKATKGICRKIEDEKPDEQKQAEAWAGIENKIRYNAKVIKGIDDGTEPYHRSAFVTSITGMVTRLANNGETELVNRSLALIRELNAQHKKPIITERNAIFKLSVTAEKVAEAKQENCVRPSDVYPFPGGKVVLNYQENRLQIKHDNKPERAVIDAISGKRFNWSPLNKAWQYQLHNTAIHKANELLNMKIPYLK